MVPTWARRQGCLGGQNGAACPPTAGLPRCRLIARLPRHHRAKPRNGAGWPHDSHAMGPGRGSACPSMLAALSQPPLHVSVSCCCSCCCSHMPPKSGQLRHLASATPASAEQIPELQLCPVAATRSPVQRRRCHHQPPSPQQRNCSAISTCQPRFCGGGRFPMQAPHLHPCPQPPARHALPGVRAEASSAPPTCLSSSTPTARLVTFHTRPVLPW